MIGATGIWSEEEQSAHIFSYGVARWVAKNTGKIVLFTKMAFKQKY